MGASLKNWRLLLYPLTRLLDRCILEKMTKDTCACKGAPGKLNEKNKKTFPLEKFKRKREGLKFKNEARA